MFQGRGLNVDVGLDTFGRAGYRSAQQKKTKNRYDIEGSEKQTKMAQPCL